MKMIALKDFYDHYAGRSIVKDEVFTVLDSRKDDMLNFKVDGEPVCEIYNETIKVKKPFVLKRNDAVKYISLAGTILYILVSLLTKTPFSSIIYSLVVFFFLYNIYVLVSYCLDNLKAINKSLKK